MQLELRMLEEPIPIGPPPACHDWQGRGGTSTSSIRCPRNVAFARISVSRNDDVD